MSAGQGARRWPGAIVWLHAVVALMVIATAAWALYLVNPPDWSQAYIDRYAAGIVWHKLAGVAILVLALGWGAARLVLRAPPGTDTLALRIAARAVHLGLWLCVLVMTLSGYVGTVLYGGRVELPGVVDLTLPLGEDHATAKLLGLIHADGVYVLGALLVLHIAGALAHRLLWRDGVVSAMSPRLGRR